MVLRNWGGRRWLHSFAAGLAIAASGLFLGAQPARAGTVPSGFQDQVVFSGLTYPTAVSFAPDGRVFVAEKSGLIKIFDGLGDTTPTIFADLRTEVHNFYDRGLLGMTLDPQFPIRPYVYVLYTRDALPGGNAPHWGQAGVSSDPCPNPSGDPEDGCLVTGRLSRLTATGDVMSAQTPLLTDWCQQYSSHSTGDLAFGPDGALYVSGGDGASYNFGDWGQAGQPPNPCGDPPNPAGTADVPPTAQGGALRSQDARTTSDPTGLDGALLRVDPDTGNGMSGNPFAASADANQRRIIAFGLRNPFRITFRPGTDELWAGDVGWNNWEEIDRTLDANDATADNFGWPCYEGAGRQSAYDGANLNLCETLYSQGAGAVVAPYKAYAHFAELVSGDGCDPGSSSISGLAFYQASSFPSAYTGALFFADYSRNCIWVMWPRANGLPDVSNIELFDAGAASPVDLQIDSQGDLYYVDIIGGTIRRIRYSQGNSPPTAVATATPSTGPAPLTVQLSGSGSSDPDGDTPLSFAWDLDSDGQFDDSTAVSVPQTYTQPGTYNPAVRVSDPSGASSTDSVQVQAGNTPPSAQISSPVSTDTWAVGDAVQFSATATDAQETLPQSAYDWRVVVNHCPSSCHQHLYQQFDDQSSGSVLAPDHEYPSTLTLNLTVTDAGGLTDTESVTIQPRTVQLTFNSSPSGLQLGVDQTQSTAPFTRTVIQGSAHSLIAPSPQTLGGETEQFQSWSDGGAITHNIVASQNQSFTATYVDVSAPAAPQITDTDPDSPANDNGPEVKGTTGTGSPTQVKLYANGTCSGSAASTGTPAQFAAAGITIAVPGDATTQLSARATDAAGNDSSCSTAFPYTEDSTAPAAPQITDTDPDSPANDNGPEVKGTTGTGSPTQVKLYANGTCSGSAASTGTPAQFAAAGITIAVPGDATTQLSARATDAAGNDSSCSTAFPYTEDSTAPAAPQITDTDPDSPANDNGPEVKGTTGTGSPTQVKLYANGTCSGSAASTGTPAQFAAAGITIAVPGDATTQLSARATDAAGNDSSCSTAFPYTEDSTAPAAPQITDTDPDSPANDNGPEVKGTTGTGSPTQVKLYANGTCSGSAASTGTPAQFAAAGITIAVPGDATTQLSARATDAAGNDSSCSTAFPYTEDSTAPAAPQITDTDPDSPANDNGPEVKGTTGTGSPTQVKLYANGTCSGSAASTGTPAQFAAAGITIAVPGDATTQLSARATDAAGNDSSCSTAFPYTEDSTAPAAPQITDTDPDSPANDNGPEVKGTAEAGSTIQVYESGNCSGAVEGAGVADAFGSPGLTVLVPSDETVEFTATATDAAGNVSACSSSYPYTEDSTGPEDPPVPPAAFGVVGGSPHKCGNAVATLLGTARDDSLIGTPGPDVMVGLGGKDKLIGRGGNDVLCGGGGADRLSGGPGADMLIGGGGNDACAGGKGAGRERSCEKEAAVMRTVRVSWFSTPFGP